jgi:hypothetical protein
MPNATPDRHSVRLRNLPLDADLRHTRQRKEASTFSEQRSRLALPGVLGAFLLLTLAISSCGDDDSAETAQSAAAKPGLDAARFSAEVNHPLVPLSTVRTTIFEGTEEGAAVRAVSRVLHQPAKVSGVAVTAVDVREFEDGELVEHTRDYYAVDQDGAVRYMGEAVEDIEDGKVVGHEGQWLAGKGDAKPGIFMPADPKVGDSFEQERAPGVAEDRSDVVAVGLNVTTPAGRFDDCIKTKDFAPLDKNTEFKYYCGGVGLVREESPDARSDLVRYR